MDTAGIDVPNSRAIAKQLLTLAQDPDNQPFIVQEQGCLAGLVQYVQHEDIDVVLIATRALQFLSSHPKNKTAMREFPALVENVKLAKTRSHENPRLDEFARGTLANLGVPVRGYPSGESSDGDEDEENNVDAENVDCTNATSGWRHSVRKKKCDPFASARDNDWLGAGRETSFSRPSRSLETITLAMDGLENYEVRSDVETVVIKVQGVISVTANPSRGFVRIGTRDEIDIVERALVRALSLAGHLAKVVVAPGAARSHVTETKEDGDEYSDDCENYEGYGGFDGDEAEDDDYPEYLEEEDYDDDLSEEGARIARHGFSSLEARLEQQRREEEARKLEKSSRLIGKMSSALSNASSWLMGY
ncbi:Armadillo repeat-containing protein 1 [Hondaea fermentalgiana]|uniref:Armadillo repeat-containing protein 1 n=1 Tax=Hondaea fermentalgiana TaxID=2315210 RepID=A0A2R5GV71_9STRA|nr:Armadillo repeat-containing protein 1 [Hondaea fermentalgiana]|eukprot:GBG34752.1 Armadillo repeat-containing protein 1 [Hondaea fermentalgiana]